MVVYKLFRVYLKALGSPLRLPDNAWFSATVTWQRLVLHHGYLTKLGSLLRLPDNAWFSATVTWQRCVLCYGYLTTLGSLQSLPNNASSWFSVVVSRKRPILCFGYLTTLGSMLWLPDNAWYSVVVTSQRLVFAMVPWQQMILFYAYLTTVGYTSMLTWLPLGTLLCLPDYRWVHFGCECHDGSPGGRNTKLGSESKAVNQTLLQVLIYIWNKDWLVVTLLCLTNDILTVS